MRLFLLLCNTVIFISLVRGQKARVCTHHREGLFTGCKIEAHVNASLRRTMFLLSFCHDSILVHKVMLGAKIPWTIPITIETSCTENTTIVMSRRRMFALRKFPIFLPGTLVGAIHIVNNMQQSITTGNESFLVQAKMGLVAEDILHHWVEVDERFQVTYHVPLLRSVDSGYRHSIWANSVDPVAGEWNEPVLMTEDYLYDGDSREWYRKAIDWFLFEIGERFEDETFVPKQEMSDFFWRLVSASKTISSRGIEKIIKQFDKNENELAL